MNSWSPEFLDSQYQAWKQNPDSVDPQWHYFFQGFELAQEATPHAATPSTDDFYRNARVQSLVYHYRDIGHLKAKLDPLGSSRHEPGNLNLAAFDLTPDDLDRLFTTTIFGMRKPSKLRDIIAALEDTYCGSVGFEYMHSTATEERRWFQEKIESTRFKPSLTAEEKKYILLKLHQAETFEGFLQKAYQGEKRFSLEGGETLIPIVACALDCAAGLGVTDGVLGMAHRGRLNVLANIMNKAYDDIFAEFEGNYINTYMGGGDVKYHKGYSGDFKTLSGGQVYMTLAANPSHLEAVDPVVLGRARAKQVSYGQGGRGRVLPILVHGDAAFAGQGIIAELLNMSHLPGYAVGGTLHLIINNQIGFTTAPKSARSTTYCTDVARMVEAPIIHVNGEDPERCIMAVKLAVEYRQKFGKDVVIDMWCYRKYGHNEGDEPAFTQPKMYEVIRKKSPVRQIYADRLIEDKVIEKAEGERMREAIEMILNDAHARGRIEPADPNPPGFRQHWEGLTKDFSFTPVDTAVPESVIKHLTDRLEALPADFTPHPRLKTILARRWKSVRDGVGIDWGTGEHLAFATLVNQGIPVRLTGQDSRRGTFSHRHAVLVDQNDEHDYMPLGNLDERQAPFLVYDSPLSEVSVLGFEYGYSIAEPKMLVMWEAQFGDFANGAQVIIDQFIASAEVKWDRASGLVLLLPHGYEGQGPEHSSARLERFLQLCAENNIQVANVTTPAQFFHILRRQVMRSFRKPLIMMTPKSLLRRPEAVSTLEEFTKGRFEEIIDDAQLQDRKKVTKVLLCSGKVYYDLVARRREIEDVTTAIVRLEQIYPLHTERLQEILAGYPKANDVAWVQEEPKNMGAWSHINEALQDALGLHVAYHGRPAAATPAVGSIKLHEKEQKALLESALPARPQAPVS
ncbi:2-oxoglutarate dehydrogenase E1 component [bacterium]|nr:2-oxoglutarate dehydrogenase E1 component [bacterium]